MIMNLEFYLRMKTGLQEDERFGYPHYAASN